MDKQNKIIISVAVVVIILIAIFAIFKSAGGLNNGNKITNTASGDFFEGYQTLEKLAEISSCPLTPDKDTFAKCLTTKGLTMYGAEWCAHCIEEKALFGDSFKYINYVECPQNTNLCLAKGIQGYPTWIVDNSTTTSTSTSVLK